MANRVRVLVALLLLVLCGAIAVWFASDPDDDETVSGRIQDTIQQGLQLRIDIDRLEAFTAWMRGGPGRFKSGQLYATEFYQEIVPYVHSNSPYHREALDRWKARFPKSPTPHLLQAASQAYLAGANEMLALLSDFPREPSERSEADLEVARRYLLTHKDVASSDPYYWVLLVEISTLLGRDADEILEIIDEGLRNEPRNFDLVEVGAHYFSPKWHGDAERLEAFATSMSERFLPVDGPGVYARIYWQALRTQYKLGLFKLARISWQRMNAAIIGLRARYPTEAHDNIGALLACLAGDKVLTGSILRSAGFRLQDHLWQNRNAFDLCDRWSKRGLAIVEKLQKG